MPEIYPDIEEGPLGVRGTRVVAANTFSIGDLIRRSGGSWVLADNTTGGGKARGIVAAASPSEFIFVSSAGQVVPLPRHGYSDGQKLYLGASGALTTTKPTGAGVLVVQLVAEALGPDHVLWMPAPAIDLTE